MTKEVLQNFSALSKRLSAVEKQLSDFTEMLHEDSQSKLDFIAIQSDINIWSEEEEEFPEEEGE